jgi:dTDP-4-amino-4,6-dideoxygalactose transaminase
MSVPDVQRHGSAKVIFEAYEGVGCNYRMTDIQAAVGREQLKRLPEIVERRRDLVARYAELLGEVDGLGLPMEPSWARSNWQSFCVRLPQDVEQRQVMQPMLDAGVSTRRGVMCIHREPGYTSDMWLCGSTRCGPCQCSAHRCDKLQHSERAQDSSVILPLFPQLTHDEQDQVVSALQRAIGL